MNYVIKQKVFSFKNQFTITDEQEQPQYKVSGKVLSLKNKLDLMTVDEEVILHAEKVLFKLMAQYQIFNNQGDFIAKVKRNFSIFRQKYEVYVGNDQLQVEGNFTGHAFSIMREGQQVANITKKYFSFGDSYLIEIDDETNKELYLFIVIVIDQIVQAAEARRRNAAN